MYCVSQNHMKLKKLIRLVLFKNFTIDIWEYTMYIRVGTIICFELQVQYPAKNVPLLTEGINNNLTCIKIIDHQKKNPPQMARPLRGGG